MDKPERPPLTPEIVDALYDAASRLVIYTMAGEHQRGGDGFIPTHEMLKAARIAQKAFSEDQLKYMAMEVAEFNEDDLFEAPADLAVRVVLGGEYHYRWLLLRALATGGYAEHACSEASFTDYASAFSAGTAALAIEGRQRGERAYDAVARDFNSGRDNSQQSLPGVA